MNIQFLNEAQWEFLDAISDYEEARSGLGRGFKDDGELVFNPILLLGNIQRAW